MKLLLIILGIILTNISIAKAQDCNPKPPLGMQEIAAYSIFQGNYSNGDYPFALNYGRWMLCKKPESIEGIPAGKFILSSQYHKFIRIYTEIGLSKSDPSEREAYLDTAQILFQEMFDDFSDEQVDKYKLLQNRGRFYLENYRYISDGLQLAYSDFEAMFKMNPERTTTLADGYYIRVMVDNISRNEARKDELITIIEEASPFANPNILQFFDEKLDEAFSSPEERLDYCGAKLKENPNSLSDLECVADAYETLDMQAELIETLKKIHQLNPTFESALKLADVEKGNAQYTAAAKLYVEALENAPSDLDKKEINIDLADVYASLGDLKKAKSFIQNALTLDKDYGIAYIKLASLYGQGVTKCTAERKLEASDKVVYWLVIDYLNKAKKVDPSKANIVNSQLSTYEAVTPTTEDKFFTLSYKQGQKVKIDASLNSCYGWINETTTVR